MRCFQARFLVALCLTSCLGLARSEAAKSKLSAKEIYAETLRGTALVLVERQGKVVLGTGWVVDQARRLLVTNHHVVGNEEKVQVMFPLYRNRRVISDRDHHFKHGRRIPARVLDSDPTRDLAIIQLESLPGGVAALKLAADSPHPGEHLHSVGNPGASAAFWVYTEGSVRQVVRRKMTVAGQFIDTLVVVTSSPINPGDSGGPVVNDDGELVAVTSGGLFDPQVRLMSWCIDVTVVKAFLAEVRALMGPGMPTPAAYLGRGNRHLARALYDRALADFDQAIKGDARLSPAYLGRGRALAGKGERNRAIADFTQAIRLNPTDPLAHNQRGLAYLRQRDPARAIVDFTAALRLSPGDLAAVIQVNRAVAHAGKRDYASAIADCSAAIKLDPNYLDAYTTRAECYRLQKDYKRAIADWTEIVRLADRLPQTQAHALSRRGAIYEEQNLFAPAQKDYRLALRLDPTLEKSVRFFNRFYLRVTNRTGQSLRVYLRYETLTRNRQWSWLPSDPVKPLVFNVPAGQSRDVYDGKTRIMARQIRIWAVGRHKGDVWDRDKFNDVLLTRDGYRGLQRWTYTYSFSE
jgi:tetratricopeptide (TPR) repeat protein